MIGGPRPGGDSRKRGTCLCFLYFAGKEITLLMQTLNTLSTPEEKLAALCKKYAELVSSPPSPCTLSASEHQQATQYGVEGTRAGGWLNFCSTSLSLFLI